MVEKIKSITLFHGNNEAYCNMCSIPELKVPEYWASDPNKALSYAQERSRDFKSRPVILVTTYNPEIYKPASDLSLYRRKVDSNTHHPGEKIEIYGFDQMAQFCRLFLQPDEVDDTMRVISLKFGNALTVVAK